MGISFLGFHQRLVFWNSIHQEVASGPFCLLVNSPWPLVFILCVFFFFLSAFNLYCWKGVHFSWSLDLNFLFRDLLREFYKKYEILLMVLFLVFFLFLASEALLFILLLGIFSFIIFSKFRGLARRRFLCS